MTYSSFDCLIVERRGPVGWLINNRPDQLNAMSAQMRDEFAVAWKELDADPEVRVIVHTGRRPRLPDRRRRRGDRQRRRRHGALPPVARGLRPALHVVAPGGVEAGDHGGQRPLRRRRLPLGRRRRHRDRRVRRAVLRSARVDRPGRVHRGDRPDAQDAGRGRDAHGARRPARAHERATGLRARHDQPDRRSARAVARRGAGAGREDRQELAGGDAGHRSGRCGARWRWASPTPAGPERRSSSRCGVIPTRPRARRRSPRSASPSGARASEPRRFAARRSGWRRHTRRRRSRYPN